MKVPKLVVLAAVTSLMVVGLAGTGAAKGDIDVIAAIEDTSATGSFDVYHWWTAGGEKEAIESALQVFEERYPGLDAVSNAIPGGAGGSMVMKVKVLVITGNSPETFQAHPGYEVSPYTDSGMLYELDDIWAYDRLEERLLPGLAEFFQVDGHYYLVPIGIHRSNMIWYNKHLFEEYGIEPPQEPVTWEAFWELCEELKAKLPEGKYPLDLGDRQGWPATHAFETIMMGTSPQIYEDFINGRATEEQVREVLDRFKKFLSYVAPDHSARLWYEAAGNVYAGNAAMYLMGGWIKAYFKSRGWEYGEDYGAFAAPGTYDKFGLTIDAFVVPKGSSSPENGFRWVHTCSDTALQRRFSELKSCISPYTDTPIDHYDEITLQFRRDLLDPNVMVYPSLTHGIALPWSVLMDLHSRISDFATSSNPDTARYARLIVQALREADIEARWNLGD